MRRRAILRNYLLNVLKAVLAGLALLTAPVWADPAPVKQAYDRPVIEFQPGLPGRVSYLKLAKAQFETPHAKIGVLQDGWHCGSSTDIIWNPKAYKLFSGKLDKSFRKVLEQAHYPVPVQIDKVFDAPSDQSRQIAIPELQVGVLIKEVAANLCQKEHGGIGGVYMKVFWQAFSPEAKRVVFETTTEGSFQSSADEMPLEQIFLQAFESAGRNFLAERGYYDAVTKFSAPVPKPAAPDALTLKRAAVPDQPLAKNVTLLRSSVVTVVNSKGSGSGFFINADGYLLTDHHVVGADKFVKVKLPTGRELIGEVLRADATRDVALLKTEPIAVSAISVRDDQPNIGDEVYVLGSPLGETFNTSLTRGILSGYRTLDNQRFLQSDVTILPGNSGGPLLDSGGRAIGITVMRLADSRTVTGLNFFIPIGEALSTLGLRLN